jgi:Tfp pilus assembly protein PilF
MKHIISILSITLLFSLCVTAQNNATKKADKHFNKFEFTDAAEAYLKVVAKGKADAYVYGQLAESYYNVFSTENAEKWYAKALKFSSE